MAKLPFIVEPKAKPVKIKIGNEDTGVFEIERRGYLSVAEKSFVDGFTSASGSLREMVKVSNKISSTTKLSREDAYRCLMDVMAGNIHSKMEKDVATTYAEEIGELMTLMSEVQSKRMIAIATILLQSRVSSDWTLDDTMELDPLVLEELSNLYDLEESKKKPESELDPEAAHTTEEIKELLGK